MTNKVDQLAEMLGERGKYMISKLCDTHPSLITRWSKRGSVPVKYNEKIRRGLAEYAVEKGHGMEWLNAAYSLLDPDECPTCGRPMEMHK